MNISIADNSVWTSLEGYAFSIHTSIGQLVFDFDESPVAEKTYDVGPYITQGGKQGGGHIMHGTFNHNHISLSGRIKIHALAVDRNGKVTKAILTWVIFPSALWSPHMGIGPGYLDCDRPQLPVNIINHPVYLELIKKTQHRGITKRDGRFELGLLAIIAANYKSYIDDEIREFLMAFLLEKGN